MMQINSLILYYIKQNSNKLGQTLLLQDDAGFSKKVALYLQFNSYLIGTL